MSKNMSPRSRRFDALDQAECERIERNRAKAPTTLLLAQIVHDAGFEDMAILIDGWAQMGHEVVQAEVDDVARQVNLALGLPLTCQADVWPHGTCGKTNRPAGRECLEHTTTVQGVSR